MRRGHRLAFAAILLLRGAAVTTAASAAAPPPTVRVDTLRQVAREVWVVPDDHLVPLVPNVGVVKGRDAILVIDTGLGPENGAAVYAMALRLARGRRVLLTTTHFHPEHSLGASAFPADAYITNEAQKDEIRQKGALLGREFGTFGPDVARALRGFAVTLPARTYRGSLRLDLGGRTVVLREMPAHTRGDQIVEVPDAGVIFTGDLVEERSFPVLYDADARGARWIAVLETLRSMHPRILVPGHGHVSDVRLIGPELAYLRKARSRITAVARAGLSQATATQRLTPVLAGLHPDWEFKDLIPYEIAILYAEAIQQPPTMPGQSASHPTEPN